MSEDAIEPCDGCGDAVEVANFEGRALCYYCWHSAREATPPYHVRSRSNPGRYSHAAFSHVVYTKAEAEARAADMNTGQRPVEPFDYEPVLVDSWAGERVGHPGYISLRRAAIEAQGGRSLPDETRGAKRMVRGQVK